MQFVQGEQIELLRLICVLMVFVGGSVFAQTNSIPLVYQPLVPPCVAPGGSSFSLTVNGSGFVSNATVNWNGKPLSTTFLSSSRLTAIVPTSAIAQPGTVSITVSNPAPGGGVSNAEFFCIAPPVTALSFTQLASPNPNDLVLPVGIAADFNGDGKLDIAYGEFQNLVVQLGNGDGSFQPPVRYQSIISYPSGMAGGDFNSDGKLDLAVSEFQFSEYVDLFVGKGDGTFSLGTRLDVGVKTEPTSIVVADFNGDGKLDVATGEYADAGLEGHGGVSVFLGKGDGTFQTRADYDVSEDVFSLVAGDFDGDGVIDLVYLQGSGLSTLYFLKGNGDGTFQPGVNARSGLAIGSVTAADVNGDGKLDIFGSLSSEGVAVVFGNGDGTFQPEVQYDTATTTSALLLGDFNADGKLDAAYGAQTSSPTQLAVLPGNGDGTFQSPIDTPVTLTGLATMIAGDFNGDGKLDVVGTSSNGPPVLFLQGALPAATISPASLSYGYYAPGISSPSQSVQLTNIGQTTLVISNISFTGADAGDFSQKNNCGASLPVNGSCTISVTYTPQAEGNRSASLSITDNAPGSPHLIPLTGEVSDFSISANPPASMTVAPGQVANYSVTITPVVWFAQSVALSCGGLPAQATCTATPGSVNPLGNKTASATIAVATAGSMAGMTSPLGGPPRSDALAAWLALSGMMALVVFCAMLDRARVSPMRSMGMLCVIAIGAMMPACGGGGSSSSGTPSGTYTVTVTGTYGSGSYKVAHSVPVTLIVQ